MKDTFFEEAISQRDQAFRERDAVREELNIVQMAQEKAVSEMLDARSLNLKARRERDEARAGMTVAFRVKDELRQEFNEVCHERDVWQVAAELWQTNHATKERERDAATSQARAALLAAAERCNQMERERDGAQKIVQEYWQMIFDPNADWDAFHEKLAALPYIPVAR
jgi:hypothetical protein